MIQDNFHYVKQNTYNKQIMEEDLNANEAGIDCQSLQNTTKWQISQSHIHNT